MELLRGETLKHYLAKAGGKGLPVDEVVTFAQQAAAALAAAHLKASSIGISSPRTCL
jgi:hypothetical protein